MSHCKACGAEIDWVRTEKGKLTPVNVKDGTTHWATCPKAGLFKKPDKKPIQEKSIRNP